MITGTPIWIDAQVHPHQIIDGDTVHLSPIAGGRWLGPDWLVRRAEDGTLTLRLAALDAPELCLRLAPAGLRHQPLEFAVAAAEALRGALRRPSTASKSSTEGRSSTGAVEVSVCLLAVDVYQRVVGLLWTGSGRSTIDCLASVNAGLLSSGAAYPDFHAHLPDDCLAAFDHQCKAARRSGLGVWSADRSHQPIALGALAPLAETHLILPRLFRRLAEFARCQGLPIAAQCIDIAPGHPAHGHRYGPGQERGLGPDQGPGLAQAGGQGGGRAMGLLFREYLEGRERPVWLRDRGVACPFVECLEFSGDFCRIPGDVENFLYQSVQGERKLT